MTTTATTHAAPVASSWVAPAALLAVGVAGLAVVLPVAVYTLTLAAFGLVHVLSELRYVDERFGARLSRVWIPIGALLALVVAGRILGLAGIVEKGPAVTAELVWVALLAAVAVPLLVRERGIGAAVAGALALGLLAAAAFAPTEVFLVLAVLHNLTPLGFLAERLEGPGRGPALVFAVFAMVGLPLLVATGLPAAWLSGIADADWSPLGAGSLGRHIGAFVHRDVQDEVWAPNLFAAAVYGQCAHYVATIGILPRLSSGKGTLPWPPSGVWALGLLGFACVGFGGFLHDFGETRQMYGVLAAVHAWIEIPVLLVGLGATRTPYGLPGAAGGA